MMIGGGVELGGVFNFIPHRPEDTAHTKEKELWKRRFNNGMCPHCGQKLYKVKIRMFRRKFIPLNIPGRVEYGACVHPRCRPLVRVSPESPGDEEATIPDHVDSILDAVEENRADILKFKEELQTSNQAAREAAAMMLEDAVVQLNRSMEALSKKEEAQLGTVKDELLREIDDAQVALRSLSHRVGRIEDLVCTLKKQIQELREESEREKGKRLELEAEMKVLRDQLDGASVQGGKENNSSAEQGTDDSRDKLLGFPHQRRFRCVQAIPNLENLMCVMIVGQWVVCAGGNTICVFHQHKNRSYDEQHPQILCGHTDCINWCSAAVEQRNGVVTMVSCGDDNKLIVWKSKNSSGTFDLQQELTTSDSVHCCKVSADGCFIVSGGKDSTVVVWKRQRDRRTYKLSQVLKGHKSTVESCDIFNGCDTIVSASSDRTVRTWKRNASGEFEYSQTLALHQDRVVSCVASKEGDLLLSASNDRSLIVWRRQRNGTFTHFQTLTGHSSWINCCTVLNGGAILLSAGDDNLIRIWQRGSDGKYSCQQKLTKHGNFVYCCDGTEDGQTLVSGGNDSSLRIWKLSQIERHSHSIA